MSATATPEAPGKHAGGRPSKLTQEVTDNLYTLLSNGNTIETGCDFVGIAPVTYYDWMKRGEAARSGKYAEFSKRMKEAQAISKTTLVQAITQDPAWQAKAWILERRYPKEWGRHLVHVEHTGKDGGPIAGTLNVAGMPPPVQIVLSGDVQLPPGPPPPPQAPPRPQKPAPEPVQPVTVPSVPPQA